MAESQKEADVLVESLRTKREGDGNTEETKIATVQQRQQRPSQREDSVVINEQGAGGERRSIITSKGGVEGDDDIPLNMEIKINNEYSSLVPGLTKEEYESLKESIKQDGLWVPLIINQDGVLLDGHHRYKACKELRIRPYYIVKELNNKYDEKFFVIDSNLKRRQLNNFQKVELALRRKLILVEIAKNNMSAGARGDRNLTPLGRVDEQIGMLAGVSHDTVRKVERILLQYRQAAEAEGEEEGEIIIQKLRTGEMSINQAYKSILKEESIKKQKEQEGQYVTATTIPPVTSNNINANNNCTNTTTFTAKEDDLDVNQNCQMKQEIQTLRERIKYLEEQLNHHQQQGEGEEEWSDIGVIDLQDKTIPIKVTVNNVKRKVVLMEIDIDYYKRKVREYYREQQQQRQKQEKQKEI
jgi:hypothetical protein